MRHACFFVVLRGVSIAFATLWSVGCTHTYRDCIEVDDPDSVRACGTFLSSGSGGGTIAECIPSDNDRPVDDSCGVFVSSSLGADGNAGTKSAALKSLQKAIDKANGRPVYACTEDFAESVTLTHGTAIYGGLDCENGWVYVGATKKSAIVGEPEKVTVTITHDANHAALADLTIAAPNAVTASGSSIAVVVGGAAGVELQRCVLEAGDAMAGAAGMPYPNAAQRGVPGNDGSDACSADTVASGPPVESLCGDQGSISGRGGFGFPGSGSSGTRGAPGMADNNGTGESLASCTPGTVGDVGTAGMPGAGATGLGAISKAGYLGATGVAGTTGGPAQGGGGGGGAKGGTGIGKCSDSMKAGGASGGSGGSGGCGGAGGKAGSAGGSSIGLISLGASVSFTDVTVKTGRGGNGGDGGPGQDGGLGGPPGKGGSKGAATSLNAACNGGNGGSGGKGGKGGGGLGGHAIGIAYSGDMPATKGVTFAKKGTPGAGGKGADAMHDGAAGVQADTQAFP